ncbi:MULTISPECIES: GNAT family N-acetyltransferase [unclassified Fusibacter]|uniref:GNAT family N-acetyltransferase n=1 Tax=unclassified Fusibacter TaxID=2624464 RepID=UPI0010113D72|nr:MULTISPECIES: GNAT family N-acetyltransferase [unclassified Fusibacter]MCK8058203.1 GNAT family N-acetyltransferase [Fusibacter sp. A2]NPE20786.1 GNAT family N-acetyltransferase [Fusibacter sp. A1]RXV62992.1 GNAT family N-acetyltransferase [Fusibacter sp. A1]
MLSEGFIIKELKLNEVDKMKDIDASQYIGKAWREVEGERRLVDIDYFDPTWPNGYEYHLDHLKNTIMTGGAALAAFDNDGTLIGIGTLEKSLFGKRFKYALLDQLFVTKNKRGLGIGKLLFDELLKKSLEFGADKIYICAGSAEETIAFYRQIGCVDCVEVQAELYDGDPRDMQLEFVVK